MTTAIGLDIGGRLCYTADEDDCYSSMGVLPMRDTKVFLFPLVVETNDDGYLVRCPDIQGAFAEGDTVEEAIFNCVDVIKMIADYQAEPKIS